MNVTPSAPPNPNTTIWPNCNPTLGRPLVSYGLIWLLWVTWLLLVAMELPVGFGKPIAVVSLVTLFHQYVEPVFGSRTEVHLGTATEVSVPFDFRPTGRLVAYHLSAPL